MERKFVDWSVPLLPEVADWLIDRFDNGSRIDGSGTIIVVPGNEAGRRLQQLLLDRADDTEKVYLPPTVQTEASLPEKLYHPQRPAADEFTQLMVWIHVLRSAEDSDLKPVLPNPPPADATPRWLDLARMFKRLHDELARAGCDFRTVLESSHVQASAAEQRRWESLVMLQDRYLVRIDSLGFWDIQTARRVAVEKRECHTEKEIILLGTVDLLPVLRSMLDQIARSVTVIIHAPESLADRFDQHGCLAAAKWLDAHLPFDDAQIMRVDGANEQAIAVANEMVRLGSRYRADQITIGLPDESLAPSIDRKLRHHGLQTRFVGGKTLAQSGPVKLLAAVAEYLRLRDYANFAALIRHPDLFDWLQGQASDETADGEHSENEANRPRDLIAAFDRFYSDRLPSDFDCSKVKDGNSRVEVACQRISKLLKPLIGKPAAISQWLQPIRDLLAAVYARVELRSDEPSDHPTIKALAALAEKLSLLERVPSEVAPAMSAAETISLALAPIADTPVPPPRNPAAIEMLGWLELALDDAPALVVTTFNEGRVPSYVDADLFLPEPIRRELGVQDNEHRYARDCYATSVLLHSRRHARFIVARRNVEGDPLTPSRLLFATDRETVAARAGEIFSEESPPLPESRPKIRLPERTDLPIPPAEMLAEPIDQFSVSSFRDYLACPYRFYLNHVLKLQVLSDEAAELEADKFGTLLHDCLDAFGNDADARSSTSVEGIFDFLNDQLESRARNRFLSRGRGAIAVQLEQLRRRLKAFAAFQADRRQQGWEIKAVEKTLSCQWMTDSGMVTIKGRVDRIDIHAETQRVTVFDYKSGDKPKEPDKAHRLKSEWIDLQLPLYRHLVQSEEISGDVELGYIVLPKDVSLVGPRMASWTPEELEAADEIARGVIDDVRAGRFDRISSDIDPKYDDFAAICQSRSLGREPVLVEEEFSQ